MKITYIESKRKLSSNMILLFIYIAMIGDYCLTYWGINILDFVKESNPLMVSVMELPFKRGLLIRVFTSLIFVLLLKFIEKRFEEPKIYKYILTMVLLIQSLPYTAHLVWIYKYLKLVAFFD